MACQTMISDMLQQIGRMEHEESLQHEANQLVMESHKVRLQTTEEKIKCLIGRPKLQPQMTLQSLGKCIKQEKDKSTNNQEPKKIKEVLTHNGLPHIFDFTFCIKI